MIDLVCFGNLAPNTIGCGVIFRSLVKDLDQSGQLGRFYVLVYEMTKDEYPAVVEPIPQSKNVQRAINRVFGLFRAGYYIRRGIQERLFDFCLTKRFGKSFGSKILFSHESFPLSVREANRQGSQTYLLAPVPHCDVVRDLVVQEQERMGLGFLNDSYTSEFRLSRMRDFYAHVDHILTGCPVMQRSFIAQGLGDKVISLSYHAGIELETITENRADPATFRVFYTAHTQLLKGLPYLLEAWQKLSLQHAELVIAGTISDDVKGIIKARYASVPNVIYAGHVKDVWEYYRTSHLFACPSLMDGGPRTVWEAIACHTPVLATVNCGASDVLRDYQNGFVVPICDAEAIAERILYLYEHRDEGKSMSERALISAKKYSLDILSQKIILALLES